MCASVSSPPPSILGGTHGTHVGFPQFPDQQMAKIDSASAAPDGLEPHLVPNKGFPHEALSPSPLDLTVASNPPQFPMARVTQPRLPLRLGPGPINFPGRPLAQSFVRTNLVVTVDPAIGAPLLGPRILRAWLGCFGLQNPMHLLVPAILLGMTWRNELHSDAQRCPPSTQPRKPGRPGGSKRTAVVHSDDRGVAVLSE